MICGGGVVSGGGSTQFAEYFLYLSSSWNDPLIVFIGFDKCAVLWVHTNSGNHRNIVKFTNGLSRNFVISSGKFNLVGLYFSCSIGQKRRAWKYQSFFRK